MVRGARRGRGGRRTRGGRRNGNAVAGRQVRSVLNAPRERVRPRNVIRTRSGHGVMSVNSLRRLSLFPRKLAKGQPDPGKWWIQTLKWVGSIVMQLITVAVLGDDLERHRLKYHVESTLQAGSSVVGCIQSMLIGPSDLVASSQLSTLASTGKVFNTTFRQGRIMHLRITVMPSATINSRGGVIALAAMPITAGENIEFNQNPIELEKWTFDDVCKLPSAIVKTTISPTSIVWSPRVGDFGYSWGQLGFPSPQTRTKVQTDACLRLVIAYMDMSANTADVSSEYSLTESAFELILDGRVEVREICDQRELVTVPVSTRSADSVLVQDYARKYFRDLDQCYYSNGILYHHPFDDDDLTLDSMAL